MNKYFKIFFVLLFHSSCWKKPVTNFNWSPINPKSGDIVKFNNTSSDSKSYDWNFGDMSVSRDKNPEHTYTITGVHLVELISHNGIRSTSKTLTIQITP